MTTKKRRSAAPHMRFVNNDATSTKTLDATPARSEPPQDRIGAETQGTIKARLIGQLGSRGYGRLLAQLRDKTT